MYAGSVIERFILSPRSPFTVSFCRRYTRPRESTTCQCGSGASGALKSSDSVSTCDLPLVDRVTVPVFAFTPANGPLVRDWAAAVVTITASARAAAPTLINPFRVPCIALSSSCGTVYSTRSFLARFDATANDRFHETFLCRCHQRAEVETRAMRIYGERDEWLESDGLGGFASG